MQSIKVGETEKSSLGIGEIAVRAFTLVSQSSHLRIVSVVSPDPAEIIALL